MSSGLIPSAHIPVFASPNSSSIPGKAEIRQLCDLAAQGLQPMFDPDTGLFCKRLIRQDGALIPEGASYRYTVMTLLGLLEYERSGGKSPIAVEGTIQKLFDRSQPVDNIGDLGLLLWLCAKGAPDRMAAVYQAYNVKSALEDYSGAHEGNTMELSWFLTGLSYATMSPARDQGKWRYLAERTYELVRRNQRGHGFFGHIFSRGSLAGMFRGRIGSFADQVYPIYGFSKFSLAFQSGTAIAEATDCAAAICKAQGSLGQWWWHYDSFTGNVVQRYPVYSVHQHAMAPMALIALNQASQWDFTSPMLKGLHWIFGSNEMETPTCDRSLSVIWRAIQPSSRLKLRADQASAYLRLPDESGPGNLKMLYECWPYELGWLLYAFSNYQ